MLNNIENLGTVLTRNKQQNIKGGARRSKNYV